jgi:hypothetical protein
MTYKEFLNWCNERASDGCWGLIEAQVCISVVDIMQSTPFWRRGKKWNEYEQYVVTNFVNPTNDKIREYFERTGIQPKDDAQEEE